MWSKGLTRVRCSVHLRANQQFEQASSQNTSDFRCGINQWHGLGSGQPCLTGLACHLERNVWRLRQFEARKGNEVSNGAKSDVRV